MLRPMFGEGRGDGGRRCRQHTHTHPKRACRPGISLRCSCLAVYTQPKAPPAATHPVGRRYQWPGGAAQHFAGGPAPRRCHLATVRLPLQAAPWPFCVDCPRRRIVLQHHCPNVKLAFPVPWSHGLVGYVPLLTMGSCTRGQPIRCLPSHSQLIRCLRSHGHIGTMCTHSQACDTSVCTYAARMPPRTISQPHL